VILLIGKRLLFKQLSIDWNSNTETKYYSERVTFPHTYVSPLLQQIHVSLRRKIVVTYVGGGDKLRIWIYRNYDFKFLKKKNVPHLQQSFPDGVRRNVRGSARKFHYNIRNDYINIINVIKWAIILEKINSFKLFWTAAMREQITNLKKAIFLKLVFLWNRIFLRLIFRIQYTGCFTTCGHYCRRWFPRSLWSKKFI